MATWCERNHGEIASRSGLTQSVYRRRRYSKAFHPLFLPAIGSVCEPRRRWHGSKDDADEVATGERAVEHHVRDAS